MFQKSLPLALVAIAGCVALAPTAQKQDTVQTASPAPTAQKVSPTPVPTPLPDNILKINFFPVDDVPGLEQVFGNGPYLGKSIIELKEWIGIATSASGDMYIQAEIPSNSIPILCPNCEKMDVPRKYDSGNEAIYKQTKNGNEFEFVAMGGKNLFPDTPGYWLYYYNRRDFTFSKLTESASVSMAPWVVKGVDVAKKEVFFDTAVWPKNTGPLVLSDVGNGEFFGWDLDYHTEAGEACLTDECTLAFVRERTAFTGSAAYFVGGGRISGGYRNASASTTIFRVGETGTKEIVGKNIAAYFAKSSDPQAVHNFVYSRADGRFYIIAHTQGGVWAVYRVSEDALVP